MRDIGFFAITLENNQLHDQICSMVKDYINVDKNRQVVIFNQYSEKFDTKNIPILPISYSKYYNGSLVVFDTHSLLIAINSVGSNDVYFYTQTVPWEISYGSYYQWYEIFNNPKLKVITHNQYLYDLYQLIWNNAIGVCEEINYEKFSKFI